ncbi:hypothetical protein [Longitalea arenae]|uniref:hypothetical protein n=1 Tax=Longitalea arenae TaxID=2812558 RepID=UPI0019676C3F|nr:hypothetical protein [Longitalea arenae]
MKRHFGQPDDQPEGICRQAAGHGAGAKLPGRQSGHQNRQRFLVMTYPTAKKSINSAPKQTIT